jgi:hypothetical protein
MIVIWLGLMGATGWLVWPHTDQHEVLLVLLGIGVVSGLVLNRDNGHGLGWVCGFGAGLLMIFAAWTLPDGHPGAAALALGGLALFLGSLVATASGK